MRRLVALLLVGLAPWTVIVGPGGLELVFLFGLANPAAAHFVSLPTYLFVLTSGLPDRLLSWPASTLLYLGGLGAELLDERHGGDVRLTAGLVALAGFAHLGFVLGVDVRPRAAVIPLGPAAVGFVIWWFYWPALRGEGGR